MAEWKLEFEGVNSSRQGIREALCTLGNGYFATRGAVEEQDAGENDYPGTYLAGGYNRLKSEIAGRVIENEDLVNWPNWLCLSFRKEGDEEWFNLENSKVLSYKQVLDMERGLLIREVRFLDQNGRETILESTRLVSMDDPHSAAIRWRLTPVNWSGRIIVRSGHDGGVKNTGVKRYGELKNQHLEVVEKGATGEKSIYLLVQTNQSRIYMAQASSCRVYREGQELEAEYEVVEKDKKIYQFISFDVLEGNTVSIEKLVSVFTSKDSAISEPLTEACNAIDQSRTFAVVERKHVQRWGRVWERFNISLTAPENTQMLLRLHIFHLVQTCSVHTIGKDAGVPARGWHGEAYRGHIFWDELFIFPLLNFRIPDLTRSLLLYRYNRLKAAKGLAEKSGFRGAMFPWQSGSNGREESQVMHLNPKSGKWVPDNTYLQRHVNLAIAYNIWQYYQVTGDVDFMKFYGAEMLLEIARFFASVSTWNDLKGRYEILKVVGPDEFHTAYPDAKEPGINNNAYTNIMASWLFSHALKSLKVIGGYRKNQLERKLGLNDKELEKWDEISQKLFVPFIEDGLIAQFEGYEDLKELDWEAYNQKYEDIHRLDRILDAEGDSVNNYKVSKQADVLMLFYLFSSQELARQFKILGYEFNSAKIPDHVEYYGARMSNGSTLSRIVHSWVQARSDRSCAWHFLSEALLSDVEDIQGGTTAEGIHLGSMAGTVDIVQRAFTGLEIRDDILWLNPSFPEEIPSLNMQIYYRGVWLKLHFGECKCRIEALDGGSVSVLVGFKDQVLIIKPGDCEVVNY